MSYELLAAHQAKQMVEAIRRTPGKITLGSLPLKTALKSPAAERLIRAHFRKEIERKFALKWGV